MCRLLDTDKNFSVDELLADPIVWLLMQADGVSEQQLRAIGKLASSQIDSGVGQPKADQRTFTEYRPGVGIMLLNAQNEVLIGRRLGIEGEAWQMPQGGIDEGESALDAAFRELKEEIGTNNAVVLAATKHWLYYDLPSELVGKAWNGKWRGQRHKWFVMRFKGEDSEINVETAHPEFSSWKWAPIDRVAALVIPFKRNIYLSVVEEVEKLLSSPRDREL